MIELFSKGGPVMWPLLLCSLVSFAFALERLMFWAGVWRARERGKVEDFLNLAERGEYAGAADIAHGSKDFVVRTLHSGLVHRNYDLTSALEMGARATLDGMRRFLDVLDTIITVGPLLGILGTVIGIIGSFNLLGEAGPADLKQVTGGIAEALITTATGLSIAIATLIPYNFFWSRAERAASELSGASNRLEIVFRKAEEKRGLHPDDEPAR